MKREDLQRFPQLSQDEATRVASSGAGTRVLTFFRVVAASGLLCAWGEGRDLEFMEDAEGLEVLPVWSHPTLAELSYSDSQRGGPVLIELDRFRSMTLPQLTKIGCGVAIHPQGLKIAMSLSPAEFESKINADVRRLERGTGW